MKTMTWNAHIEAPPEAVFDHMVDTEAVQGGMTVDRVERRPDGTPLRFRYTYRILGLPARGTGTFAEFDRPRRVRLEFTGGLERWLAGGPVASTWTFEPAGDGTDVTIRPEFVTRIPGLNHLARWMLMRFGSTSWEKELRADLESPVTTVPAKG